MGPVKCQGKQTEKGCVPTDEPLAEATGTRTTHGPDFLGGNVSEAGGISTHTPQQVSGCGGAAAAGRSEGERGEGFQASLSEKLSLWDLH